MTRATRCEICGRDEALEVCAGCGKAMCRACRTFEIWGAGAEDLSVKYLCPACKEDPEINPWGAYDAVEAPAGKKSVAHAA